MKKILNKKYILSILIVFIVSFSFGYFSINKMDEEKNTADLVTDNYDKLKVTYLNIKERKTGISNFDSTSDMNGHDSSPTNNYLRTMDTMTYILELGIERNEATTTETDIFLGGLIYLKIKVPTDDSGKTYLSIVPDAWMEIVSYSDDLTEYIVRYRIPSEKSPVGGNQQLSVTMKANTTKYEIAQDYMPIFEAWMDGNAPDNGMSEVESKTVQDTGPLYITASPSASMALYSGSVNKSATRNGVKGQYLSFGAVVRGGYNIGTEVPTSTLSSSIKIEYYYKDIEHGDNWINIGTLESDPIYGATLYSYGAPCEYTYGFYPNSEANTAISGYCANRSYKSVSTNYATFYERNSGNFNATQNNNIINFTNTDFYFNGNTYNAIISDGFELFVPWYEPVQGGKYQYQVRVTSQGFTTKDSLGNDYSNPNASTTSFTYYNYMEGIFNNDFSSNSYNVNTDTSLIPLGKTASFYGYVLGTDGPFNGGLQKLIVWNSSTVDMDTSESPNIEYYDNDNYASSTSGATISYGVYKSNPQNGVLTDELVNSAVFGDFYWYSDASTAIANGKITAIKTDEPRWRGYGTSSYINNIVLKAKEDVSLIGQKGIIRQKIYIYYDSARTDVYEIGTDTSYVSSTLSENSTSLSRQATPRGIGETYYVGNNMRLSIRNYINHTSYNVEEELIEVETDPYYYDPPKNIDKSNFTIEVEIPKYLKYVEGSCKYEPASIVENSDGSSVVTWEFNDWSLSKSLPYLYYYLEISPYAPNNLSRTIYSYIYSSDTLGRYGYDYDSFYIINLSGSSVRKRIVRNYLDKNESVEINNYVYNIAQANLNNVKTIEILPRNNDSIGSKYSGDYTLKVISLAENQKMYYSTNDIDNIGLTTDMYGKKHIQPVDLDSDNRWIEVQVNDIIPSNATAIATYIPQIEGMSDITYKMEFIPNGNTFNDSYYFKVTASSDNLENAIETEYKGVFVVDRIITGYVFEDVNKDGLYYNDSYNAEYYDLRLSGKIVKVYNENGEFIKSVTTNDNGMYYVYNLEKGNYYIEYELDAHQSFVEKSAGRADQSSVINPDTGRSDIIQLTTNNHISSYIGASYQNVGIRHSDANVIVHHYIEGTETPVHEDQVMELFYTAVYSTSFFKTYDLDEEYRNIYEYNGTTEGDSISGNVDKDVMEITYYYTRRPATLKVHHYIKGTTEKIAGDDISGYLFGILYTTSRLNNPNYNPAGEGGDLPSGIITKEVTEVIYYYEKKPATITVHHYIEGTDTPVHEDDILNRNYNDSYATNYYESSELDDDYKNIYEYGSSTGRTGGTINEDSLEVIYYYTKKDAQLIIHHYALGTTFKVHENEVIDKKMNDPYETHHKESNELFDPDYVYDSVEGNETGTMDTDRIVVNYYYKLKEGNIVVHHITDDTNEPMCPDETASGPYKTKYNYDSCTELTNINYTFKEINSNDPNSKVDNDKISGRIGQDNTEITYYYTYKPGQIVVHYFLAGTRERVSDDTIANGKLNQEYTSSAKELEGYKLVKEPENKTLTYKENTQELIYEYEKLKYKIETRVVEGVGTITGSEEVFYGDNAKNNVIITPGEGYEVNSVIVNGKELTTLNIQGMTLNKFEGVKENILVEVKFIEKTQDVPITGKTINKLLITMILLQLIIGVTIIYRTKIIKKDIIS